MPPAGMPRPEQASLDGLAAYLETTLDRAAAARPNPGRPALRRLTRTEYGNAIRDLLALEIDAGSLLPADDSRFGFDNIGSVLTLSPLLAERYLAAARHVRRLALEILPSVPRSSSMRCQGPPSGRSRRRGSAVRNAWRHRRTPSLPGRRRVHLPCAPAAKLQGVHPRHAGTAGSRCSRGWHESPTLHHRRRTEGQIVLRFFIGGDGGRGAGAVRALGGRGPGRPPPGRSRTARDQRRVRQERVGAGRSAPAADDDVRLRAIQGR